MKIIDAIWDEKVTGLKTCEILFQESDNYKTYIEAKLESLYEFSVVKIPIGNLELVHNLEDFGYRYLENQLDISFNVDQIERIDPVWERLLTGFNYKIVTTHDELEKIKIMISENMFDTDRYSQDPFWGSNISSLRYNNWVDDLYENKLVRFYIMVRNGEEVGFFTIKRESDSITSCPIAGIFNKNKFSGYIFVLGWYLLLISRELGVKRWISSISTNNRNILSSFSKVFTFRVTNTYIVLRKVIPK